MWAGAAAGERWRGVVADGKVILYDEFSSGKLHQPHQHDRPQLRGHRQGQLRRRRPAGARWSVVLQLPAHSRSTHRVRFGIALESRELLHVLNTHDNGCILSSHRVRSDVCVC